MTNILVDSGTDANIRAAIAALGSNGGAVLLGPNQFNINATLTVPSNIAIIGSSWHATKLLRKGDFPIFDILGTNASNHVHRVTVAEMQLDGGLLDGGAAWVTPVTRQYYADTCYFEHINWQNANTMGLKCVDTWDTTWHQCRWDNLGGAEGSGLPSHVIYGADPTVSAGQFGRLGGESSNDCRYTNCTWESFRCGGFWINPGGGAIGLVATQTLRDCKMDCSNTALGQFLTAEACNILSIFNMDGSIAGAGSGFSGTQFNLFEFKNSRSVTIDGFDFVMTGGNLGSSPTRALMRFDSSSNPASFVTGLDTVTVRNQRIQIGGTGPPALGYVNEFVGTANNRWTLDNNHMIGNATTTTAMYGGTMPNIDIGRDLAVKAGTPTDSLFGTTQVPGLLTNEALGPVLDTSANKVWFRFPDGTWRGVAVA